MLKTLLYFTAVLCANLELTLGVVNTVHYTRYEPKDSDLYVNLNTFWSSNTDQGLTTVACPHSDRYTPGKNCTVTSHIEPKRSCPVSFNTTKLNVEEYLEVLPFGDTGAVIFWGDADNRKYNGLLNVKYTIVNLETCESKQFDFGFSINRERFSYEMAHATYVVHGLTFEFISRDPKYDVGQWNKYHIDSDGNFVSKSEPWRTVNRSTNVISAFPIVVHQEITSFVYSCWVDRDYQMILSKSDGSEKLLMHWNNSIKSADISTTSNRIGIALVVRDYQHVGPNDFVDIGLFDFDGNLKLRRTFTFQDTYVKRAALLNFPNGFILIAGGCKDYTCDKYPRRNYHMLKVSNDGRIIGAVKNVEANSCDPNKVTLQLFLNREKNYCVSFLCTNVRRYNTGGTDGAQFVELLVKCYDDDDFTNDDLSFVSNVTL